MEGIREEEFWRQMYEEASDRRRKAEKQVARYKAEAAKAETGRLKWRKAVIMLGLVVACSLCVGAWAMLIGG